MRKGVAVFKDTGCRPECWTVYSSKGGVYRWWEYPATEAGYLDALSTADAVAEGIAFPPPVEEVVLW